MRKQSGAKITILGQPSWRIATRRVEAFVTELGGHLAPVTFDLAGRRTAPHNNAPHKIMPYSVAPWAEEKIDPQTPAILRALRGDFFCMPFGGNDTAYNGEKYPIHGESANAKWKFESIEQADDAICLHLSLKTKIRIGRVDKRICLIRDHTALYCRHAISGMSGAMPVGHHATLKFPDRAGSGVISTSPFVFGQVMPTSPELPENRGYSILKPGAKFESIWRVPTITGESADLSRYPARRGYEDIVMLVADDRIPFAWTAVAFTDEGYVWFALKNPRILRSTIFWISNGGRHYAPWNGRHVNVMGLEEVTAYFPYGLAESAAANPLSRKGYPTAIKLDPKKPTTINYIMAVAAIPKGFDAVESIESAGGDRVEIKSKSGKRVRTSIDLQFLDQA